MREMKACVINGEMATLSVLRNVILTIFNIMKYHSTWPLIDILHSASNKAA